MTPDQLFSLANTFALLAWIALIVGSGWRRIPNLIAGFIVPGMLAALYLVLILGHWGDPGGGNFSSLPGVAALFSNPWKLLAGWVHYLAFDLFIGSWEVRDAQSRGISHWFLVPALALTFLFGPIGLLAYLATREIAIRIAKPQPGPGATL